MAIQNVKVLKAVTRSDVNGGREATVAQVQRQTHTSRVTFTASATCVPQYLAEANVDAARVYYAGGPGWYGPGWYWDPFFTAYTWIPGTA